MNVGDILVAHGLVTKEDLIEAVKVQHVSGGSLGDCLVSVGAIDASRLKCAMRIAPTSPHSLEETGLSVSAMLGLMIKSMSVTGEATLASLSDVLKLPIHLVQDLFDHAESRRLLDLLGASRNGGAADVRYTLTQKGMEWAREAMAQSEYVGPAPVTLDAFCQQVNRQRIATETVDRSTLEEGLKDLVIPEHLIREIGPALNSGRSILLHGAPGNGKTVIGERIAQMYRDIIYLPYCFEVDGQIIRLFDPVVHQQIGSCQDDIGSTGSLRRENLDQRWVACRRPCVITGGELTLEMLDLRFDPQLRYYEAPLHIKAVCGVFLIDDFGRQLVSPTALLNRWIVPLGSGVDYLKLHTGKSFQIPFDALVIFSTNMPPADLMDPAFLRRIPYKIEVGAPSPDDFRIIFSGIAQSAGLEIDQSDIDDIIARLVKGYGLPLASYQPGFLVEQLKSSARFDRAPLRWNDKYATLALKNLSTQGQPLEADFAGARA